MSLKALIKTKTCLYSSDTEQNFQKLLKRFKSFFINWRLYIEKSSSDPSYYLKSFKSSFIRKNFLVDEPLKCPCKHRIFKSSPIKQNPLKYSSESRTLSKVIQKFIYKLGIINSSFINRTPSPVSYYQTIFIKKKNIKIFLNLKTVLPQHL